MKRRLALALLVTIALALAACGSETSDGSTSTDDSTTTLAASDATEPGATVDPTQPAATSGTLADGTEATKPVVSIPKGDPPTELETKDLVVGTGAEAKAGDTVTVQYVGNSWSTGEQFDASWDRGQPFSFPLGAGQVIQGWDQGVEGMKVGGRRQLTIPPDLGYGPTANGDIAANETLVFVVDLVSVD